MPSSLCSMNYKKLKLIAGAALLGTAFLGAMGMKDTHQAKLPLVAIWTILYCAWLSKKETSNDPES